MSATNSTTHYELPVFLGSDKPAWLVDWNGAMAAIDSAIYEAKTTADSATSSIATVAADLATLSSTVSTQGSDISTLSGSLTTLIGTVNTITSLIGNGEPTTTDKTIIGAINEINAKIPAGGPTAAEVSYDNTSSGLTADDVQEAVDEIAGDITAIVEGLNNVIYTSSTSEYLLTAFEAAITAILAYSGVDIRKMCIEVITSDGDTMYYHIAMHSNTAIYFGTLGALTSWYTLNKEGNNYYSKKCVLGTGSSDYNPTVTKFTVYVG